MPVSVSEIFRYFLNSSLLIALLYDPLFISLLKHTSRHGPDNTAIAFMSLDTLFSDSIGPSGRHLRTTRPHPRMNWAIIYLSIILWVHAEIVFIQNYGSGIYAKTSFQAICNSLCHFFSGFLRQLPENFRNKNNIFAVICKECMF